MTVCVFSDPCEAFHQVLSHIVSSLCFTGRYMRFNGVNKPPRTKATLYQPLESMESSYCVKARYKICDDGVLSIHTSFVYGEYVITGNALWSRKHAPGGCSGWQQLSLPMPYKQYPHRVTIQGVVNSQNAEICLDDLQILLGDCLWYMPIHTNTFCLLFFLSVYEYLLGILNMSDSVIRTNSWFY